uniref:Uncharacterized protein n=1 Tax=Bionectria ochroleuca TaxID=29856 RepID=A0A8H7NMA5_BIOOC
MEVRKLSHGNGYSSRGGLGVVGNRVIVSTIDDSSAASTHPHKPTCHWMKDTHTSFLGTRNNRLFCQILPSIWGPRVAEGPPILIDPTPVLPGPQKPKIKGDSKAMDCTARQRAGRATEVDNTPAS